MASTKLFAVFLLVIVVSAVLFSETEGAKYCKTALVNKIYNTCRSKWFSRRKRDTEDVELEDFKAKAFLLAHKRVRRGWASVSPGMQEECCKEECNHEEVREVC